MKTESNRNPPSFQKEAKRKGTKLRGDANLFTSLISICFLAVLLMFSVLTAKDMDTASRLQLIGRRYISAMETTGYLTAAMKASLNADLMEIGAEEVNFHGSSLSPVSYGQEVVLQVTGTIPVSGITGYQGLGFIKDEGRQGFTLARKITAKY